jgi:endonuclease G, mitochondrial
VLSRHRRTAYYRGRSLGDNRKDVFFTEPHGVKTPDIFWKVIIRNDRAIAWMIPNSVDTKKNRLDDYIVSIQELYLVTGRTSLKIK